MDGGMDGGMRPGSSGGTVAATSSGGVVGPSDAPVTVPFDGGLIGPPAGTPNAFKSFVAPQFPKGAWSPRLRAQAVLAEFTWTDWKSVALPPPDNRPETLKNEIKALLDRRWSRGGRMSETLNQAQNIELYFANLLTISPGGRPATATLMATGMAVGHMVGMYWKHKYNRPRPAQIYPALMPAILSPAHASYPSNHALQSHLVAWCLYDIFEGQVAAAMRTPLFALADRIAVNREIVGVHFESDSAAGEGLAAKLFPLLKDVDLYKQVRAEARKEWEGIAVTAPPANIDPEPNFGASVARAVAQALKEDSRPR
jgi:acid phosphatase (class A)